MHLSSVGLQDSLYLVMITQLTQLVPIFTPPPPLRAMLYTLANVIPACPFLRLAVGTEMYARLYLPYKSIVIII